MYLHFTQCFSEESRTLPAKYLPTNLCDNFFSLPLYFPQVLKPAQTKCNFQIRKYTSKYLLNTFLAPNSQTVHIRPSNYRSKTQVASISFQDTCTQRKCKKNARTENALRT